MKTHQILLILLLGVAMPLVAKTVYKTQDKFGNTVYSDSPSQNSEEINIPEIQTYSPTQVQEYEHKPKTPNENKVTYNIDFLNPKQDQIFTHDINKIEVVLIIDPPLAEKDGVQLRVNGKVHGKLSRDNKFTLTDLPRGSYELQAQVFTLDDKKSVSKGLSKPITIHQQRAVFKPKA